YENWDELKEWIDGLPRNESVRLNHPTSIHRRYNRTEPTWDGPTRRHRIEDVDDLAREYPELMEELRDEVRQEQIKDVLQLKIMYPHLAEEMRESIEAQVRRERSQGIMTRDTFDKLVACLEQSNAEYATEILDVVRKLGFMLVMEEASEDIKEPE